MCHRLLCARAREGAECPAGAAGAAAAAGRRLRALRRAAKSRSDAAPPRCAAPLRRFCRPRARPLLAHTHHRVQVVEALHQRRRLGEFLAEGVAEVVRGVGRNDQHALAARRQLHREAAAARRLADAALAAHEDPLERGLVRHILQRGLRLCLHGDERACCCCERGCGGLGRGAWKVGAVGAGCTGSQQCAANAGSAEKAPVAIWQRRSFQPHAELHPATQPSICNIGGRKRDLRLCCGSGWCQEGGAVRRRRRPTAARAHQLRPALAVGVTCQRRSASAAGWGRDPARCGYQAPAAVVKASQRGARRRPPPQATAAGGPGVNQARTRQRQRAQQNVHCADVHHQRRDS